MECIFARMQFAAVGRGRDGGAAAIGQALDDVQGMEIIFRHSKSSF